jgi:hypothetical protein
MTDLSPQAQAVMDAYLRAPVDNRLSSVRQKLAAALLAAADQVVPEEPELNPVEAWSIEDWNHMNATKHQREESRRRFLTIAAELDGTTTTQEK